MRCWAAGYASGGPCGVAHALFVFSQPPVQCAERCCGTQKHCDACQTTKIDEALHQAGPTGTCQGVAQGRACACALSKLQLSHRTRPATVINLLSHYKEKAQGRGWMLGYPWWGGGASSRWPQLRPCAWNSRVAQSFVSTEAASELPTSQALTLGTTPASCCSASCARELKSLCATRPGGLAVLAASAACCARTGQRAAGLQRRLPVPGCVREACCVRHCSLPLTPALFASLL